MYMYTHNTVTMCMCNKVLEWQITKARLGYTKILPQNLLNNNCLFLCVQVNTEVCEQTFSWLSKYSSITRHMNRQNFLFYILYICKMRNRCKQS